MDATWEGLASDQQLEAKIHDPLGGQDPAAERFVSVLWPFEDFLEYFSSQPVLMDPVCMEFHEPDYRYVLIVRGDEFPCGARPWCQLTVSFANHGERARSINYTWTFDLSLCSEHNVEALRDLMAHNLECIQHVPDNGYIVLCGYRVHFGCIVGVDSPWLRHVSELSVWWGVRSLYTYAMWNAASNQWEHTTTVRSWKGHRKVLKVVHQSRPKATVSDVFGCIRLPPLKVHDQYFSIVMCILHCLISVGKQTTIYMRRYAKKVAPAVRVEVQRILTEANTKIRKSGWRLEVKHNARMCSLYWGAMRRCSVVTVSAAMQANRSLTSRMNQLGRVLFPTFFWTVIGVFRFLDEGQPMPLHVHPCDEMPLSCEVSLGAHVGGEL